MADPIQPIVPNIGNTGEAIAASAEMILTSTDRDLIKNRLGTQEIDTSRKFMQVVKDLLDQPQTLDTVLEAGQVNETEPTKAGNRVKIEQRLIKGSPYIANPQERIEISPLGKGKEGQEQDKEEEELVIDPPEFAHFAKEIDIPKDILNTIKVTLTKQTIPLSEEANKIAEELKAILVDMYLSSSILEKYNLTSKAKSTKSQYEKLGAKKQDVEYVIFEAKKTAWLKSVVILKELHLKRVFSSSVNEFKALSRRIKDLTLRARKLGLRISPEGVKWIEAKLESLAYDTAAYKLQLLESMQKMSPEKERANEIYWLKRVISHIKK